MKRRSWILAGLVAAVAVVGITAGTALAQGGDPGDETRLQSFVSRVAAKLGVEEAQVQQAFQEAAREMKDEAMQRRLDMLVEQGRLSQADAEAYMEWFRARPEGMHPGLMSPVWKGPGKFGMRHHGFGQHGWGEHRLMPAQPAPASPDANQS